MTGYPKREQCFAHKFTRLLMKSCAAMDIGQTTCLMLTYIAHTEDALRYSGPVRFWNEQLMTTMGFKSPKQLVAARDKAIANGWLNYERSGNREVGKYWVTIPAGFEGLSDAPVGDIHSVFDLNSGMNSGMNTTGIAEREGDGKRNEKGTESGKPSNPIPIPNPNPKNKTVKKHELSESQIDQFETFWLAYPRRIAKGGAKKAWATALSKSSPEIITAAASAYAATNPDPQFVPHPATWLNTERWMDEPPAAAPDYGRFKGPSKFIPIAGVRLDSLRLYCETIATGEFHQAESERLFLWGQTQND